MLDLSRERGSNAWMGVSFVQETDIAILIFLFRNFKDLPNCGPILP